MHESITLILHFREDKIEDFNLCMDVLKELAKTSEDNLEKKVAADL